MASSMYELGYKAGMANEGYADNPYMDDWDGAKNFIEWEAGRVQAFKDRIKGEDNEKV